jgi:hypothetical protein
MTTPTSDTGYDLLLAVRDHAGPEADRLDSDAGDLERKADALRARARQLRALLAVLTPAAP